MQTFFVITAYGFTTASQEALHLFLVSHSKPLVGSIICIYRWGNWTAGGYAWKT